jgi:hypothetical protein
MAIEAQITKIITGKALINSNKPFSRLKRNNCNLKCPRITRGKSRQFLGVEICLIKDSAKAAHTDSALSCRQALNQTVRPPFFVNIPLTFS